MRKISTFSVREAGKLVGFPGGEIKFYSWLRGEGLLLINNEPYQKYIDKKWFTYSLVSASKAKPSIKVPVTRMTIKGVAAIQKLVLKNFPGCPPCP